MKEFNKLIEDQFKYGGKKYGLNASRESTDVLFDKHGKSWLFGTMDKYTFRFKNLERERDILKIACYGYILWLKKGFFVKPEGLKTDVLDTNIKVKLEQFDMFVQGAEQYKNDVSSLLKFDIASSSENILVSISSILQNWSKNEWKDISSCSIYRVYYLCFLIWKNKYAGAVKHDTDTFNETTRD